MNTIKINAFIGIFLLIMGHCLGNGFSETIKYSDIMNTVNFHFSDFLQYSADIDVNSTDFYHWRISIDDLSDYQENGWQLMVDGHLLKPHIYGEKVLNQLALSSLLIDSVEIISHPEISNGNFSDKGTIHLHTVKPDRGFNCYGAVLVGNESGDPGPYKYTDRSSPNIDKIGHDNSMIIEHSNKFGWFRFALYHQQHIFTDSSISKRIIPTTKDWPGADKMAVSFDTQYFGKRWTHSMSTSWVSNQPSFLFIDVLGREYPVHPTYFQWSYSGDRQNVIKWYADYNLNQIRQCDKAIQSLMPYDQHSVNIRLELFLRHFVIPGKLGYQINGDEYISNEIGSQSPIVSQNITMEFYFDSINSSSRIVSSIIYFDEKPAFTILFQNKRKLWKTSSLYGRMSMNQRHVNRDPFFQFWCGPGRSLFEESGFSFPDYPELSTFYSADIGLKTIVLSELKTHTRFFIHYQQENWWFKSPDRAAASGPVPPIFSFNKGTSAGLAVTLSHQYKDIIQQKLSFKIIARDRNTASETPAIKSIYGISYYPDRNFLIFLNIIYQSQSRWNHYEVDQMTAGMEPSVSVVESNLDAGAWGEIGFNKWLWNRRMLIRVALQNLANQQLQYHPLGMNREMSMIAGLNFWFKEQ